MAERGARATALLALAFSALATTVSAMAYVESRERETARDEFSARTQLRQVIARLDEIPRDLITSRNQDVVTRLTAQIELFDEQDVLAHQAAVLAEDVFDDLSSAELRAVGVALREVDDFPNAYRHLSAALERSELSDSLSERITSHRELATLHLAFDRREDGIREYQNALRLVDEANPPLPRDVHAHYQAYTHLYWAWDEATTGHCREASEHLGAARGLLHGLAGAETVLLEATSRDGFATLPRPNQCPNIEIH